MFWNADPPTLASNATTSSKPIERRLSLRIKGVCERYLPTTLKNCLGSIPCADVASVPVFFRDCIAARSACTIATAETNEKTRRKEGWFLRASVQRCELTDDLSARSFSFSGGERRRQTTRNYIHEHLVRIFEGKKNDGT